MPLNVNIVRTNTDNKNNFRIFVKLQTIKNFTILAWSLIWRKEMIIDYGVFIVRLSDRS